MGVLSPPASRIAATVSGSPPRRRSGRCAENATLFAHLEQRAQLHRQAGVATQVHLAGRYRPDGVEVVVREVDPELRFRLDLGIEACGCGVQRLRLAARYLDGPLPAAF